MLGSGVLERKLEFGNQPSCVCIGMNSVVVSQIRNLGHNTSDELTARGDPRVALRVLEPPMTWAGGTAPTGPGDPGDPGDRGDRGMRGA